MISSKTRRRTATSIALLRAMPRRLERLSMPPRERMPQDTEQGCRALAAADLARADELQGFPRARMEHSAAAWTARADLLDRIGTRPSDKLSAREEA